MFSSKDLFFTTPSGYTVSKSLRFRSSATAYLNRTAGSSATNQNIGTWSFWLKRGTLGASQRIFEGYTASTDAGTSAIEFNSTDNIAFGGWTVNYRISTQVFRDPSAFYHFVVAIDTTQSTANNRVKIYVNGAEITAFSTTNNPTQNTTFGLNNNSSALQIGRRRIVSSNDLLFDGYLADVNFIDGQALTPSSFGAYDTNGVWQPARYTGSYGTNGYYLKFTDTTSTTTLVADSSGNGNNWTPNNISLTAGTTYDSMIDSPTNYADGGTGRGDYCVLNPLKAYGGLYSGNLSQYNATANWTTSTSTFYVSSGKWYWETIFTNLTASSYGMPGIVDNNFAQQTLGNYPGVSPTSYGYFNSGGTKYNNATGTAYGAGYVDNDVIGVALDMDGGTLTFYKNGVSQGTAFTGLSGSFTPAVGTYGSVGNANFGQQPFAYTPPSGFSALNTQNLTTPTIANGAQYMAAVLYTGTGSSQTITTSSSNSGNNPNGTTFQPDFVWAKGRSGATDHAWYDAVRGVQLQLESNTTTAETTETTGLTAFTSSGFTTGALAQMNTNTATYVAWEWNAGGSTVTNTSGSITSSVRASTTAGFSIVTFTSTASTQSVGHGLGVTPSLIILKSRSTTGNWGCYHQSLGVSSFINLNSTAAAATVSNIWAVSSTTFTPDQANLIGGSGITCVAYCFASVAGYSAFGSYTGNGSADGPFVYTGFRPRWIMIKQTTASGTNWIMIDTSRSTYNVATVALGANSSLDEPSFTTTEWLDVLSNGFKIKIGSATGGYTNLNISGNTYIYAAFAENPFKISRAR